jgi:hypothetical protein
MPPIPTNERVSRTPNNEATFLWFLIWSGVGGVALPGIVWLLSHTSPTLWSAEFAIRGGLSQIASNILAPFGPPLFSVLGNPIPFTPSFLILITMAFVLQTILAIIPGTCFGGGLYLCVAAAKTVGQRTSRSLLYFVGALALFAIAYISITIYWSEIKKANDGRSIFDTTSYYFLNQSDLVAQAKAKHNYKELASCGSSSVVLPSKGEMDERFKSTVY